MNKKYIFTMILILAATASAATLNGTGVIKGGLLNIQMAKYEPTPSEAGKIATIWVKAENKGIEPVPNASFILMPSYPFSLPNSDAQRSYGMITGLDDIKLEYRVLVDKRAINGTYSMKMKYQTGDGLWLEKEFSITVKEFEREKKADLKALYVKTEPPAYSNGRSRVTIDIANVGDGAAYYVIAKADSDIAYIERNMIFVSTLEPNDFDSVDFDVRFKGVIGSHPINITMIYKDKDSNEVVQHGVVYVSLITQEAAKNQKSETPAWAYALYLILLIVAVKFVFMPLVRRRRSE